MNNDRLHRRLYADDGGSNWRGAQWFKRINNHQKIKRIKQN